MIRRAWTLTFGAMVGLTGLWASPAALAYYHLIDQAEVAVEVEAGAGDGPEPLATGSVPAAAAEPSDLHCGGGFLMTFGHDGQMLCHWAVPE